MDIIDIVHYIVSNLMSIILIIIFVAYWYWQNLQKKIAEEKYRNEMESMSTAIVKYERERNQNRAYEIRLQQTIERLERETRELREETKNVMKKVNNDKHRIKLEKELISARMNKPYKESPDKNDNNEVDYVKIIELVTNIITCSALVFSIFRR